MLDRIIEHRSFVDRPIEGVYRVLMACAGLIMLLILGILLVRITGRQLGIQLRGLEPLAQLLVVWGGFLIAGNMEREDRHISVDMIRHLFSDRINRLNMAAVYVLSFVTVVVIAYSTVLAVRATINTTMPGLGIPVAYLYAAPLIGMIILAVLYAKKFVHVIREGA